MGFAAILLLIPTLLFASGLMTVHDVLRLLEAGVSERIVIAQIEESRTDFDLSTNDILALEESGVGDRVIEAMIRSGSSAEIYEEEEEIVTEEISEVPAHLGYYRYSNPHSIEVRLVPWSVPAVTYVELDSYWWDPWWWDTPYYVSYHYYPGYRPHWRFASSWCNPYNWHHYHNVHWYNHSWRYHDHYNPCGYGGDHHNIHHVATQSSWKKKTGRLATNTNYRKTTSGKSKSVYRSPSSRTKSATSVRNQYRTPVAGEGKVKSTVSQPSHRKKTRGVSGTTVKSPVKTPSRNKSPARTSNPRVSSGSKSKSRPAPAASGSRSKPSGSSGSSGGKKKGR